MNRFLVALALLLILLAAPLSGAVLVPEYSKPQLQDKNYVQAEIERFARLREEVVSSRETASAIVQMTLEKDLKKIDAALEALRYVEANGYDPADPELQKLEYFQGSTKGAGEGLHHGMTPAGPPGGRVSYLDGKSSSRTEQKTQPKRNAAPRKPVRRPRR